MFGAKQRFCIERVVFIVIIAIIAGIFGADKTDLGPYGLALMVGFIMACFYGTAKTLFGIGGFTESIAVDTKIPAFDWKRFVVDPLVFIGICLVLLVVTGIGMLLKWAFSGGEV